MDKIYDRLIELAKGAVKVNEVPNVAIIIDDNHNIVAESSNYSEALINPLKHAEINCLEQAFKKKKTKVLSDLVLVSSLEPCPMCATAITYSRIEKCIFLVKDEKGGAVLHNSKIPKTQNNLFKTSFEYLEVAQSKELKKILQDFFKEKRN